MATPHQGRTALYRLFDIDSQLLYVGIASNPRQRWPQHASVQPWWPSVHMREVEWFPTREEAETAEAKAIAEESPRWNKNGGIKQAQRGAHGSYWRPDAEFKKLVLRFARTQDALTKARTALEDAIVAEFKAGASAYCIADHVPWTRQTLYALAKRSGVPRLRKPTVGHEVTPDW